jgi:lipopolysaccharide exporter
VLRSFRFGTVLRSFRFTNEVFAATFVFSASTVIRMMSSIVLTRLLYPEAYGVVTIISAVAFTIEMLADLGVVGALVRHKDGDKPHFVNALWTIRFFRGCISFAVMFFAAPWIAQLYELPLLESALRVYAFSFLGSGLESMSFVVMVRHGRARISAYCELVASVLTASFTIAYAYHSRDHFALIYGLLIQRAAMTFASYWFEPAYRPRFVFDREAARALFEFSKYVVPSSMISLVLAQYERIVFLKLFDLQRLGIYGIAANIAGSVEMLTTRLARNVLYPRCARYFREAPETACIQYYTQNTRLFVLLLVLPALLCGAAQFVIDLLYDPRYAPAGLVLQALAVRGMLSSWTSMKENLLEASGHIRMVLISNVLRICWLVPVSLLGYYFWGFEGFLWGLVFDQFPGLIYNLYLQAKAKLLIVRHEVLQLLLILGTFIVSAAMFSALSRLVPILRALRH